MKIRNIVIFLIATIVIIASAVIGYSFLNHSHPLLNIYNEEDDPLDFERIVVDTLVNELNKPWEIRKAIGSDTLFFTQSQSGLYKYKLYYDEQPNLIYTPSDLYNPGEGGMLGFELDNNFTSNNTIYACFNSNKYESYRVVVAKLTFDQDLSEVVAREDIITDIPATASGRHSGCRIIMDSNQHLWITTGDMADSAAPQSPTNLAGKILRVDAEGNGVDGNLESPFDPRIFSYGHRNPQGLEVFDSSQTELSAAFGFGLSSEHGPDVDDEINQLGQGNFGWDPGPFYSENVPMTDTNQFPEAMEAIWTSGNSTIAISGIELLEGEMWGDWQGDLLVAALKDSVITRFTIDKNNASIERQEDIITGYGRIRQVYQADDDSLYFSTDNGDGQDIIAEIDLIIPL